MLDRRSIDGLVLMQLLIRLQSLGLGDCVALQWWPLTVALPVAAASAAATSTAAAPPVAGFAFAELSAVLSRPLLS